MPDADTQRRAEQSYWDFVRANPSEAVQFLFEAVRNSNQPLLSKLAFILLFRLYQPLNEQFLEAVSAETHEAVTANLPALFTSSIFSEENTSLLAFGIAAIAHAYLRNGGFANFLPGVFRLVVDGNVRVRECALECLDYCVGYFGDNELQMDKEALLALLRSLFCEGQTGSVLAAGIRLLFGVLNKKYLTEELVELVPAILTVYQQALGDEKLLATLMFDFYMCCHLCRGFFGPWIAQIIELMLHIVRTKEFNENVKRTAIDIMYIIAQDYPGAIAGCLRDVCLVYMMAMSEIDPEDEWNDETSFSASVSRSFGDLAELMDPCAFVGNTLELVQEFIGDPRWETSYAALRALRTLIPACYSALDDAMDTIIRCLVEHLRHPHARVRCEAYDALTRYVQIADVAVAYREPVLQALLAQIAAEPEPIVKAGAVCALSCVCRNLPKELLEPLVDPIATSLIQLFDCGNPVLQAQVVRALSSVALIAPDSMAKFYSGWMEMMKRISAAQHDESSIGLLCRVIESTVFLRRLVPSEVFAPDLSFIMDIWLSWKWEELPDDVFRHLLSTFEILIDKARDVCLSKIEPIIKKMAVILIAMEPVCVKYNAYEMSPQSLRPGKLMFLVQENVYLEYDLTELQKMQQTLELVNKVMLLAGNTYAKAFYPFRKRFVNFMQWDFYARIPVAAVTCMATVSAREPERNMICQFSAFLRLRLTSNAVVMSPLAQKRFLEVWRKIVMLQIGMGVISERNLPEFLSWIPGILDKLYQRNTDFPVDERLPLWQVEEPLALMVVDLYDKFTALMLQRAFTIFRPIVAAQKMNPGAFLVLVCSKHASISHDFQLSSVLTGITDGITSDCCESARIACNAMNMLIGNLPMEGEFVNEVLCCVSMALATHGKVKATVDSALVLLTKLMHHFPDVCVNPDTISAWLEHLPLTTEIDGSDCVYQFLAFLLTRPDILPMTDLVFVKVAGIVASITGTSLASQATMASFREFFIATSQDPRAAPYIAGLDERVRAKLNSLCS